MNKNKMTFRFDHSPGRNNGSQRVVKEEPQVIPLHVEEYRVEETPRVNDSFIHTVEEGNHSSLPPQAAPAKQPLIDAQPLNLYTTDYGGWQSSFDAETNRVEQLIRESNGAKNRAGDGLEPKQDLRDRYDREEPSEPLRDHRWYVPEEPVYVSGPRKPNTSWIKVATSVAGAIVTGIAFGFFVLSMFSGDNQAKTSGNTAVSGSGTSISTTQGAADKNTAAVNGTTQPASDKSGSVSPSVPASASAAAGIAASIPAKSYSFLQSGVFSTPQSADAAQADLKKKGFTAVRDSGDKYPVYVGIAMTRDEAMGLSQQFKQKNMEVIVKNVELPALTKIKWNGKQADSLPNYMNQGAKLVQSIVPLASSHLMESKPSQLDASALQSIKTAHQAWTGLSASATEGLADDAKAALQKMNTAMSSAIVSLDEYKKNPGASYMWQTEAALMQYVMAEKELRKLVTAE
ncbi:hypothetical protein GCM10023310_36660 [Paenibacillus vulneris]|uniref:SPOR domain-containing protein n=1 Tax=Paenibacillus vulneris TaxID=1133364 RepID=A0ABW3URP3_9BACL